MIYFLNEMELTDKLIKQYATEHDCDETTAANIFKLTAARLTAVRKSEVVAGTSYRAGVSLQGVSGPERGI